MRAAALLLTALSIPSLAGGRGGAAPGPGATWPVPIRPGPVVADSEDILDAARSAQRRFERTRRQNLPRSPYVTGRCQEHVGRFCLHHDDLDRDLPPEPPKIGAARRELLAALRDAARWIPGDHWVRGQRVRYLIEAGSSEEALVLARSCPPPGDGWCYGMLGYALHAAGLYEDAESAFARALVRMPREERCRWTDLSAILEGKGRGRYADLGCEERTAFEAGFWWLADPLRLVPGNDRRTEHYARHFRERLLENAANGYGVRWGSDLRRIVLRYGWPVAWELAWRRSPGLRTDAAIQGRDAPGARHYLPPAQWVDEPEIGREDSWELDRERPKTLYAPAYTGPIRPLEHQLAIFLRGEKAVVAAAYDLSHDTIPPCDSLSYGLFVPTGPASEAAESGVARGPLGRVLLTVPASQYSQDVSVEYDTGFWRGSARWLSLEVHCPAERRAYRARYGVTLAPNSTNGLGMSDLLVLEESDELPESLAGAAARARGSLRVRAGERLGLYWEVYDERDEERELDITVALTRKGKSFLRKVVEWAGLAREREQEVGLSWRELPIRGGAKGRSVELTLPDLPAGRYLVEVRLSPSLGPVVASATELRIEP